MKRFSFLIKFHLEILRNIFMYFNEDIKYEKPDKFVQTCEVNNQIVT